MWFLVWLWLRDRRPRPKPQGAYQWARAFFLAFLVFVTLILIGRYA